MPHVWKSLVLTFVTIVIASNSNAATLEQKCLAGRAKAKGKYEACMQTTLTRFGTYGGIDQTKFSKCRLKHAAALAKLQELTGTTCDVPRFVDNGDGTITDNSTGLMWEQKTTAPGSGANLADPHDVDNVYLWSTDANYRGDGTTFTSFLAGLNSPTCASGHCDWRLPTLAELFTILAPESYPCTSNPCVDPVFLPVSIDGMLITETSYYYTSTTIPPDPAHACDPDECVWIVHFQGGDVNIGIKDQVLGPAAVRAVRGGF